MSTDLEPFRDRQRCLAVEDWAADAALIGIIRCLLRCQYAERLHDVSVEQRYSRAHPSLSIERWCDDRIVRRFASPLADPCAVSIYDERGGGGKVRIRTRKSEQCNHHTNKWAGSREMSACVCDRHTHLDRQCVLCTRKHAIIPRRAASAAQSRTAQTTERSTNGAPDPESVSFPACGHTGVSAIAWACEAGRRKPNHELAGSRLVN